MSWFRRTITTLLGKTLSSTGLTSGARGARIGDGLEHLLRSGRAAASDLKRRGLCGADICLVLGSGFGGLPGEMEDSLRLPYGEIPGMPVPGVEGHAGMLHSGTLGGTRVIILEGRVHYYEGIASGDIAYPLILVRSLGVKEVILTCASGGVSPSLDPGDLLLVRDHVNLSWRSPLREMRALGIGRFVDMVETYDRRLSERIERAAVLERIPLCSGVLAAVSGPCYETIAEIEALRRMGIDAVTMSTIPETIIANYLGLKTACISLITNTYAQHYRFQYRRHRVSPAKGNETSDSKVSVSPEESGAGSGCRTTHREVLDAVERSADMIARVLKKAVRSS